MSSACQDATGVSRGTVFVTADGTSTTFVSDALGCLTLVAEDRTIRGIANILEIAGRTVVFHKSDMMDKLGLRTTAELTCYAIRCGLLAGQEAVNK